MRIFGKYYISVAGSAQILSGQGTLAVVNINTAAAATTLTLYDSPDNTGSIIATIDCSVTASKVYLAHCNKGLYYTVAGGNPDVTISYE